MEKIIKDRYYDKCKKFIQEIIDDDCLDANTKEKIINMYNSLNVNNAKKYYDQVEKLYETSLEYAKNIESQKQDKMLLLGVSMVASSGLFLSFSNKIVQIFPHQSKFVQCASYAMAGAGVVGAILIGTNSKTLSHGYEDDYYE